MEHLTTTTDMRDLDCLYLATIGGVDYFETRQIIKQDNGVRAVVGLASAWPIISRDARIRELTALLAASERRSIEADCHVVELLSRLNAYEELFALRPASETPIEPTDPAPAQLGRDDGRIQCDEPGCLDWVKPRGMAAHKRQAHGVSIAGVVKAPLTAPDADSAPPMRKKCPFCTERPKLVGMQAHIERRHPEHVTIVAASTVTPIALALGERPWSCDHCHESTHARSLKDPALCIRCVADSVDAILTNGHLVAA